MLKRKRTSVPGIRILLIPVLIVLFNARPVFSSPLGDLSKVGKSQSQIQRALDKETAVYTEVKKALINNELNMGSSAEQIQKHFGPPVVIVKQGDVWRHLYKPAHSTHFSGEKIYLFFDENGKLVRFQTADFPA